MWKLLLRQMLLFVINYPMRIQKTDAMALSADGTSFAFFFSQFRLFLHLRWKVIDPYFSSDYKSTQTLQHPHVLRMSKISVYMQYTALFDIATMSVSSRIFIKYDHHQIWFCGFSPHLIDCCFILLNKY